MVTARSKDQVLTGPGQFFVAPVGTAFPADAETAPAATWEDIGYTDDGVAFEWEMETQEVVVAEEFLPIRESRTRITYQLVTTLAQFVFENLERALGGGTITTIVGPPQRRTYEPPTGTEHDAFALLFRYENEYDDGAGNKFHTDLQVQEAKSVEGGSAPFTKSPEKSVIPVTFNIELPSSGAAFTFDEYISAT